MLQITQKFDDMMAGCDPRKLICGYDASKTLRASNRYDIRSVIDRLSISPILNLTYSDALHIIVAVFQSQPLSLKYLAMKKVLEYDLEVKDLPEVLQVKGDKAGYNCKIWI